MERPSIWLHDRMQHRLEAVRAFGLSIAAAGLAPLVLIGGYNAEYGRHPLPPETTEKVVAASAAVATIGLVVAAGAEREMRRRLGE